MGWFRCCGGSSKPKEIELTSLNGTLVLYSPRESQYFNVADSNYALDFSINYTVVTQAQADVYVVFPNNTSTLLQRLPVRTSNGTVSYSLSLASYAGQNIKINIQFYGNATYMGSSGVISGAKARSTI